MMGTNVQPFDPERISLASNKTGHLSVSSSILQQLMTGNGMRSVRRIRDGIMLMGLCIPMCTLAVLLSKTIDSYNEVRLVEKNVETTESVSTLIGALQRERGLSCVFLETLSEEDVQVAETLFEARAVTNEQILKLRELGRLRGTFFEEALKRDLGIERKQIIRRKRTCPDVLKWFTKRHELIIQYMSLERYESINGQLWTNLARYDMLMFAQDLAGVTRSMGATHFAVGVFTDEKLSQFSEAYGAAQKLLDISLGSSKNMREQFKEEVETTGVADAIQAELQLIRQNQPKKPDLDRAFVWFQNMSSYMSVITMSRSTLFEHFKETVKKKKVESMLSFLLTSVCGMFSLFVTPTLTIYFLYSNNRLLNRVSGTIESLKDKSRELNEERQKIDIILHQIMPKAIVKALKSNGRVVPETYDSVTIYFSDVVGFTVLSSKSSPLEVVDFLNQLYSTFDKILDQYDVYKVETIGDAYMVVSGLPTRNEGKHVSEIATVILETLKTMDTFHIPHIPQEKIMIRVSCHTGSCAAGVVGLKMPRYCLFGDTVNTASRMESTSFAGRCQLSEETKHALDVFRDFETSLRGQVEIKGKGMARTFWLLGKRNFPFRVSLDKTAADFENAKYCKQPSFKDVAAKLPHMLKTSPESGRGSETPRSAIVKPLSAAKK